MLAEGIIDVMSSPYFSPLVMVAKKDGIMEDSAQPLPAIHEVLKDQGRATIFATLYLRYDYWQILLMDRAKKYTAFVTSDGDQYAFMVIPLA
jgi:hypothetical protein